MSEIRKIFSSLIWPVTFVILLFIVKITSSILHTDLYIYGILPRNIEGLRGIIFSPLIHGDYKHLISNTFPLIVLGWTLFYFYRNMAIRITILSWVISGLWVWVFAREVYHIGASTIIYAWASFLFVSGIIRNHPRLMALSLLIAFLYGSMVWGIFPIRDRISWEGHLMGMLAGVLLAWYFRESGPERKKYSWDFEEEAEEENTTDSTEPPYWMGNNSSTT